MRYELTDLKLFLAVAESESLSAGASVIHISAPSASYRLKNLEQAIGADLFIRSPKGMSLTPAGRVLLSHVRTVLSAIQHMQGDVAKFGNGVKGHIKMVANSSCMEGLTSALSRYLGTHPNINVELEERLSADIVRAVTDKSADIGLLAGDVMTDKLSSMGYGEDELILVTPVPHVLSSRSRLSFEEALDADFITLSKRSSNTQFLTQMADRLGRSLKVRVNVHSFPVVLRLVEENVGVSIVPRSVAVRAIQAGRVAGIQLTEAWAKRKQSVIAIDFDALPEFVREFVEYLKEPRQGDAAD
ncbi:LysR family transcriptional regulator [Burkholderia sp. BCC0419]|uniref:LysR family transcriptional regulator n=1 Tax=Burkholderia sp. BCC0419 TaxID=486878 RepID=UPI00158BBB11|nr:LysR family transcriptional regulator [Burkholderia sp. BCC0419]